MNGDEAKSGQPSGGTSPNGQTTAVDHSEAEFLAREAETARRAVLQTLEAVRADITAAADLRRWAREHPWWTAGLASLAGVIVVGGLTSRVADEKEGPPPDADLPVRPERRFSLPPLVWNWLVPPLFQLLGAALEKFAAALRPAKPPAAAPPATADEPPG